MSKMDWKDKQLEKMLREMPQINDNQSPHNLYQAISLKLNKKKRRGKLIPVLSSVAVAIILIAVLPNLFQFENQVKQDIAQESKFTDLNNDNAENFTMIDENSSKEQYDTNLNEVKVVQPYLLRFVENKQQPLLEQVQMPVATFDEALLVMKQNEPNQGLTASIPNDLVIEEVSSLNEHVTIKFGNPNEIPQTERFTFAIEAILLTARDFDYSTLEFKHHKTNHIGPYPINKPIEVSVITNKLQLKY